MPNWYQNEKLKSKVRNIVAPALIMAPLGVGLGLMNNEPKAPAQPSVQKAPTTAPASQPTTKPTTQPATQPAPTSQPSKSPAAKSNLVQMLKQHEGYELKMYPDTKGIPTIGIGFNLQKPGAKQRIEALGFDYNAVLQGTQSITDAAALKLFHEDVATAQKDIANVVPDFSSHPKDVQNVLTDMMFNMGINRFSGFKNMLAAVNAKDYSKAADEMQNSKWFGQVGDRGPALVSLMRSASAQPATQPAK